MTSPDIDLTPISVGFELRLHPEMQVQLPEKAHLRVRYQDSRQQRREVSGTPEECAAVLRLAGYAVAPPSGAPI